MPSKEVALTDKENDFIYALLDNGGNLREAGKTAGYHVAYVYTLRNRLAKHIALAAQEYFSMHAVKAAKRVIDLMDAELPNPVHLNAAKDALDRAGVKPLVEQEAGPVIKANIFILPEKQYKEVIEHEQL